MSRVSGKDTAPEMIVRKMIHGIGFRYRLHTRDLPGSPDITLRRLKKAIFVHGCFWHGHEGCKRAKRPSANADFWNRKIDQTIARDAEAQRRLREMGWEVLVVWQCQMRDAESLYERIARFLIEGEAVD